MIMLSIWNLPLVQKRWGALQNGSKYIAINIKVTTNQTIEIHDLDGDDKAK